MSYHEERKAMYRQQQLEDIKKRYDIPEEDRQKQRATYRQERREAARRELETTRKIATATMEEKIDRHRQMITTIGRRNSKDLTAEIAPLPVEFQIAVIRARWEAQYGITVAEVMERIAERKADNEMIPMLDAMVQVGREVGTAWAAWQAAIKIAAAKIAEAAAAFCDLRDAVVAAFNETWPRVVNTLEEIQKLMEQYADVDEPEEEDRHDGAVEALATWLPPVPSLYELYGQGVDRGGPGPSRLTLTRVTDDGLRRAETGQIRKGENTMIIFLNILLGLIAFVLFLGTVGEKDGTRQKNITLAFVATLAAIVLINFVA